jgi:hypothetical protein
MTVKRSIPAVAALAAIAAGGVASAQQSTTPRLASDPFLGRVSGGAAVRYKLTRTPASQTVTIAGHAATVKVTDKSTREYTALIHQAGLRAGRTYAVAITAVARSGKTKFVWRKIRFLHRSLNQPQSG